MLRSTARPASVGYENRMAFAMAVICTGVFFGSSMDALFKFLSGGYPLHQIMVIRGLVALPMLLVLVGMRGRQAFLVRRWGVLLARAVIMSVAFISYVLAVAAMPLADAVAIYFAMPLMVAAMARPLLGERVPPHRWLAIVIGLAGVLIMIRPGAAVFEPAALFALFAALAYGLGQSMTRLVGPEVMPSTIAFYSNLVFLAFGTALAVVLGFGHFEDITHKSLQFLVRGWTVPGGVDLVLMVTCGVFAVCSMLLFTLAYRSAEANFVAPFEYTSMLWALIYGLVLWGDRPDGVTITGAALVIGAGLYMLHADRRAARRFLAQTT